MRRPPRSAPVPYTTLFRSIGSPVTRADLQAFRAVPREPLSTRFKAATLYAFPPPTQGLAALLILGIYERLAIADRKSTRLNSSHANISYAVFCLKKQRLAS